MALHFGTTPVPQLPLLARWEGVWGRAADAEPAQVILAPGTGVAPINSASQPVEGLIGGVGETGPSPRIDGNSHGDGPCVPLFPARMPSMTAFAFGGATAHAGCRSPTQPPTSRDGQGRPRASPPRLGSATADKSAAP
jgi:hypothetical protein